MSKTRVGGWRGAVQGALKVVAKMLGLYRPRTAPDEDFAARHGESIAGEDARYQQLSDEPAALNMPFSNLAIAPIDVYRFGLVLGALQLGRRDEVLDFGAGTGWVSAMLNRMGIKTVSLEVSANALDLARRSFELDARHNRQLDPEFVVYDGHRFPFDDERFDRVVSFAAFHHVSNQRQVLEELYRVTRPGGRVVFCEPTFGHAEHVFAQRETAAWGVFERDVDLGAMERDARSIGFERLVFKPYSQTPFDELHGNSLLRNVAFSAEQAAKRYLYSYAVFYLQKGGAPPPDSSRPGLLRAEIEVDSDSFTLAPLEKVEVKVTVTNTGDTLWLSEPHPSGGHVAIGCQLLHADGRWLDRDWLRFPLPGDVAPGAGTVCSIEFAAPANEGAYRARLDLVSEWVCWFEEAGSPTKDLAIEVVSAAC